MRVFFELMWFFKQHKWRYISGIALLLAVAALNLIPPHAVGVVVNELGSRTLTRGALFFWLYVIAGTAVLSYALRYSWRMLLFGAAMRLAAELRRKLYEHFVRMAPQFYHDHRVGDLMAHATNDVQAVEMVGTEGILMLVDSIATGVAVTLTMVLTISWQMTVVALLPMPIIAYATSKYGKKLHERFHGAQRAFSELNEKVQENISGVRVIRAFGQEEAENRAFAELSQSVVDRNVAVARIDSLFDPTIQLVVGLSYVLSVAAGSYFVVRGHLTVGALIAFTMYLGQLIWPMLAFGWLFNIVERGRASNDRITTLLAAPATVVDRVGARDETPTGDISYAVRSFHYPDTTAQVLRDIAFTLPRGRTLGVVGRTGAGKSTLLRLLLREFDVQDGDIRIGGDSVYDVTLAGLRRAIAYVPQDHYLFSATVAENIAFAAPAARMEDIRNAARSAGIAEDIERFPDGYGTLVGERGVTLSGGQKQRISIARALLLDAEILILDDALSAVDAKTEALILDSLRAQRSGRTTLIATHRLSAVEHADLILTLDGGRVAEAGTHDELRRFGGLYEAMYQRQQLESLVEAGGATA